MRELAESLANAGHSVHVVTYPTAQHMVPIERISIHRAAKLPGLWTVRPFGWQKAVLDFLLFCKLYRVVRRERIQIIHAHNLEGPLIAYLVRFLTGVPVVYHAHNALTDELPCYFRSRFMRQVARGLGALLDRRVASEADYTIALSDRLAAFLAVRGAAGRVATVVPAVGQIPLRGQATPAEESLPLIMYAGNLDPYQNLDCLLEGFDRVCAAEPQARLVVVTHKGAHPETRARAAVLARRPGVSVRVVNSFAAAARELSRGDVLVCPRTSWSGFPIKVLNYMALGRPVVQARASAHAIEDGVNGLLFTDDDSASLAGAVIRIARDPVLALQLGRQARGTVLGKYTWRRVLPRVLAVYGEVVKGRSGRRGARCERRAGTPTEPVMGESAQRIGGKANSQNTRLSSLGFLAGVMLLSTLAGCSARHRAEVAPLPPLAAAPALGGVESSGQYRIEPGDVLRVKFLYHPELDVKVPVGPDGMVSIQGVGEVQAEGKTAEDLAADIESMSADSLRDPVVTVIVAGLGTRNVYVGGEVRSPGPVSFREGMTPLQAILDRGGFTEVARTDSVLHLTAKGNTYEARRLDYSTEIEQGAPELNALGAYDVIYVPRTFIGDANAFVRLYIRGLLPTMPRLGVGLTP